MINFLIYLIGVVSGMLLCIIIPYFSRIVEKCWDYLDLKTKRKEYK